MGPRTFPRLRAKKNVRTLMVVAGGQVTLEEALLKSLNVPTVKLCAEIGVDKVPRHIFTEV
jgi:membrane peptidoglycan carboxypeptidase